MRKFAAGVLFILLSFVLSTGCFAFGDELSVHGFVSQGYLTTTENNWLVDDSKGGTFELTEAAINFMAQPTDELRFGIQLYSRDLGKDGNNSVVLDWGYGDYRWRDYLGVRVGRIKVAWGLYNQYRDIDMARTTVYLPQSMYDESTRDFALAYQGANLYGNIPGSGAGDIDYDVFYGTINISDPATGFWRSAMLQYANIVGAQMAMTPGVTSYTASYSDPFVNWKYIYGGSLIWNTPLDGLRLGGSFYNIKLDFGSNLLINLVFADGSVVPQNQPLLVEYERTAYSFSGEYTWNNLKVLGEFRRYDNSYEHNLSPDKVENSQDGFYTQVDYNLMYNLGVSAGYSVLYDNNDDKSGDNYAQDFLAWEKDMSFSARYNINPTWLVKFDLHMVNGAANLSQVLNPGGYEEDWMIFAVKTTYNF